VNASSNIACRLDTGAGRKATPRHLPYLGDRRVFVTSRGVEDAGRTGYQSLGLHHDPAWRQAMAEISAVEGATGRHRAWPAELRLSSDRRRLSVRFDDGHIFALDAEYLRVESPSAEVQGHSPAERKFVGGKQDVEIIGIDRVGHYAVRLSFDDMHSSGIYSWDYLYELGRDRDTIWKRYLDGLAVAGGSRSRSPR
jgi:DUF971 family protein